MSLAASLSRAVGSLRASDDAADRVAYARDLWPRHLIDVRAGRVAEHSPSVVVWPESVEEVEAVVRFARDEGARVVPFGAGSGVCGAVLPDERTIVVDMKRLASWSIDEAGGFIDVGPGALGVTLEEDIQRRGVTIGHFPSSILCSTVGGWIAARGAGQCSGLYGKIEDMVASIDCVLGTGDVVTLRRRFDGPDLVPLMIGSEGTLGVITGARLRVHPVPASRAYAAFEFDDMRSGWDALREIFQSGLRPAVTRLYDPVDSYILKQSAVKGKEAGAASRGGKGEKRGRGRRAAMMRAVLSAPGLLNAAIDAAGGNVLGGCTMVLVFEGAAEAAQDDRARARELGRRAGGEWLGEGPARRWFAHRYGVSYRQAPVFRMGAFSDTMEVSAPWSKLGALYDGVREALGEHVLVMAHMSHAYPDGCSIYFTFAGSASDDDAARELYDRSWEAALGAAVEAGGAVSHHHGVGRSKTSGVERDLGFGVEVVRRVMRACDPSGVMNPGAVVPRADAGTARGPEARDRSGTSGVDVDSLLVTTPGATTLGALEDLLNRQALTLGLTGAVDTTCPVAEWIARGVPGTFNRWHDPVDQVVAGLVATLTTGEELSIRPEPRRAVGPDLLALFSGAGERVGRVSQATLRVHRVASARARELACDLEANPKPSPAETATWEAIAGSVALQRDS